MTTLKQEISKQNKLHKQKLEEIKKEFEIKKEVSKDAKSIYQYSDNSVNVHYGNDYRNEGISLNKLLELMQEMPPEYKFINDQSHIRSTYDETFQRIYNYSIDIKNINGTVLIFRWTYKTKSGHIVDVHAIITDNDIIKQICYINYDRKEYRGGFRIENTRLYILPLFDKWSRIKWGRGTEQYPNDFTLYNTNTCDTNIIELLKQIKA